MKKVFAIVLVAVLVCCLMSVVAFAKDPVISPENTPDAPPASPQTGYGFGIVAVFAVLVLAAGVAVVVLKKLHG